jgi:hypothetical protein
MCLNLTNMLYFALPSTNMIILIIINDVDNIPIDCSNETQIILQIDKSRFFKGNQYGFFLFLTLELQYNYLMELSCTVNCTLQLMLLMSSINSSYKLLTLPLLHSKNVNSVSSFIRGCNVHQLELPEDFPDY